VSFERTHYTILDKNVRIVGVYLSGQAEYPISVEVIQMDGTAIGM